jgi:release factor glutamine methyltransferase
MPLPQRSEHPPDPGSPPEPPGPAGGSGVGGENHADAWPVGRLLTWTSDFLKKRGSESPRLDAEVLLAHALRWERVQLYTHFDDAVPDDPRTQFRNLVRRRAEGTPVAYLVGRKEFYSLPLAVSPDVLIPRPDSEFVVVEFLAALKGHPAPRVEDVGTGSGCLALACAQHYKTARFWALDLSAPALAVAAQNARALKLDDRVEFREGDLLAPVAAEGPFDAIISNPPYIPTDVIATLEPGVRDYEPHLALDGGPDGLRVVARLIAQAVPLLKPGGQLILEIGSAQEEAVRSLIAAEPSLQLAPTVRDHANHPRVIRATRRP